MTTPCLEETPDYVYGATAPKLGIVWDDDDTDEGELVDFSDPGWSFVLKIGEPGAAALKTKTTGIVGLDETNSPNVLVTWAATDLELPIGTHVIQVQAIHASLAPTPGRIRQGEISISAAAIT